MVDVSRGKRFKLRRGSKKMTDAMRRRRMEQMFEALGGVLAEDYDYFTGKGLPDVPMCRSKAGRRSAQSNALQVPEQN